MSLVPHCPAGSYEMEHYRRFMLSKPLCWKILRKSDVNVALERCIISLTSHSGLNAELWSPKRDNTLCFRATEHLVQLTLREGWREWRKEGRKESKRERERKREMEVVIQLCTLCTHFNNKNSFVFYNSEHWWNIKLLEGLMWGHFWLWLYYCVLHCILQHNDTPF